MSRPLDESELPQVRFVTTPADAGPSEAGSRYDMVAPDGNVFARAELFPGDQQWGVRLADRAPELEPAALLRLIARLLVWEVGCCADTVDVVLSRTHDYYSLVRVGGDYV